MIYELLIAQMLGQLTNQLITWQCISIGVYLAGLGLGSWKTANDDSLKNPEAQFVFVETILAFLGAILVSFISIMHIFYRAFIYSPIQTNTFQILAFTLTCEIMTLAIGYFSGMEIPIILSLWKKCQRSELSPEKPASEINSATRILAMSYFGALLGSLFFSLWLYPSFHYVKTSSIAALLSFFSAFFFIIVFKPKLRIKYFIFLFFTGSLIYVMIPISQQIYNLTIQNYYYGIQLNSIKWTSILIDRIKQSPPVQQIITPVQTVDIVYSHPNIDLPFTNQNPHIPPYYLYLDQRLQYFSADEYNYHETMVHIPIQISSLKPKKVLILGGGDGLLARELLKYPAIESITLVEIDSSLLDLVDNNSLFYNLNRDALQNPKVNVVRGDAFHFTRTTRDSFDAIFADFPWPFQYDLAKLYSVEFYSQLIKILHPDGFLILDFPILNIVKNYEDYISIMVSTLRASGFKSSLVIDLNKESFIFTQPKVSSLNYDYQNQGLSLQIPIEKNLADLKANPLNPKYKETKKVNSIFKPIILSIVDPRF